MRQLLLDVLWCRRFCQFVAAIRTKHLTPCNTRKQILPSFVMAVPSEINWTNELCNLEVLLPTDIYLHIYFFADLSQLEVLDSVCLCKFLEGNSDLVPEK